MIFTGQPMIFTGQPMAESGENCEEIDRERQVVAATVGQIHASGWLV